MAEAAGLGAFMLLGHGDPAAAVAIGLAIVGLIVRDLVHPPAVATALRFVPAHGLIAALVIVQRLSVRLLARVTAGRA